MSIFFFTGNISRNNFTWEIFPVIIYLGNISLKYFLFQNKMKIFCLANYDLVDPDIIFILNEDVVSVLEFRENIRSLKIKHILG